MKEYHRKVFLREVDVTGRVYFGFVFDYAIEAFECWLEQKGEGLKDLFSLGYRFPVVHAEANYLSSLSVSDEVIATISFKGMSERSFTIVTNIYNKKTKKHAVEVTLIHAFLREGEEKASQIPREIRSLLETL